jgi:tetratricopeptide (TPR) repeat protein
MEHLDPKEQLEFDGLMRQAILQCQKHSYELALAILEDAIELANFDEDDPYPFWCQADLASLDSILAVCYQEQGKLAEAYYHIRRALLILDDSLDDDEIDFLFNELSDLHPLRTGPRESLDQIHEPFFDIARDLADSPACAAYPGLIEILVKQGMKNAEQEFGKDNATTEQIYKEFACPILDRSKCGQMES